MSTRTNPTENKRWRIYAGRRFLGIFTTAAATEYLKLTIGDWSSIFKTGRSKRNYRFEEVVDEPILLDKSI